MENRGGFVRRIAGDMFPALVLAIQMTATIMDVVLTIQPYPTLLELA